MNWRDDLPILVATGQRTWRDRDAGRTPLDALHEVANLALDDAGAKGLAGSIDAIATVRFITDTNPDLVSLFPRNPGKQLALRVGIEGATYHQGTIGGNTPQYLVNHFARKLAKGELQTVLIAGVELLDTFFSALKSGDDISAWQGESCPEPETIGVEREGLNAIEQAHGLFEPINTYPLFENALSHHLGQDSVARTAYLSELCSAMSAVATGNPHAWYQQPQTAQEIATVTPSNRYIGYPYTRAMNPVLAVDAAAAVILTTVGTARELGIDPDRYVFFNGGADVNDIWYLSERETLFESPAIRSSVSAVLGNAGIGPDDIARFDIYSCFPSAVEIACREIGISALDPRGVTVTGGLPFFGGPGNNYSLHAIAEMVRQMQGEVGSHGLVTANGLYLTKHSIGLYSTAAPESPGAILEPSGLQDMIDRGPRRRLAENPCGNATVETFTVAFGREGPQKGIVVALNTEGERVIANTESSPDVLQSLLSAEPIGLRGDVTIEGEKNIFRF